MGRTPKTQQLITDLLTKEHILSALQLLEQLQHQQPLLNRTTIYRALDKLLEDGKICRHIFGDDTLMYELRSELHHDHLVCEQCGKVRPTDCQTKAKDLVEGFSISHHHTTLFGVCSECIQR